jgi:pyruvate-ferredoxin/flavodoxin oxidoreductase
MRTALPRSATRPLSEHPFIRGTAQNPDVYFQARETCNTFYMKDPGDRPESHGSIRKIDRQELSSLDYVGAPDATEVIVIMGSGAETTQKPLNSSTARAKKSVGYVRLYRPFSIEHFIAALPATVKTIAVLDRTKEPGAIGEPLYQDVVTAINETLQG